MIVQILHTILFIIFSITIIDIIKDIKELKQDFNNFACKYTIRRHHDKLDIDSLAFILHDVEEDLKKLYKLTGNIKEREGKMND